MIDVTMPLESSDTHQPQVLSQPWVVGTGYLTLTLPGLHCMRRGLRRALTSQTTQSTNSGKQLRSLWHSRGGSPDIFLWLLGSLFLLLYQMATALNGTSIFTPLRLSLQMALSPRTCPGLGWSLPRELMVPTPVGPLHGLQAHHHKKAAYRNQRGDMGQAVGG